MKAWKLFQNGEMKGALEGFETMKRKAPDDPLFSLYTTRCQTLIKDGVPSGWDGVIRMTTK